MQKLKIKYGNTALVTGASTEMGQAFALELAKQGIKPILVATNKEELSAIEQKIDTKYNIKTQIYTVDLSDEIATVNFIKNIDNQEIGMFIHCAGMETNGSILKALDEKEMQMIKLNITSTYLLTNYFAKKMTHKKMGGILLVSSLAGLQPSPYFSYYSATKSYVHNLGLSLFPELKRKGIDISVLALGLTEPDMITENGKNWSKIPLKSITPERIVEISLTKLGKKATIIPGFINKIMVTLATKVFSLKSFSSLNGFMIKKAISNNKL